MENIVIQKNIQKLSLPFCPADYLGLSKRQQNDLGLLIHVLYSNPKVLYAPNGTQADEIIQKVRQLLYE